ncbi:hypothetical protein [Gordonia sp. MP11Mi]|uniref:hypothetical protein n=1 Tax=Gordonia sp. MP11Mi TaxID=3022769 RepID=UPI003B639AD0
MPDIAMLSRPRRLSGTSNIADAFWCSAARCGASASSPKRGAAAEVTALVVCGRVDPGRIESG